ncbi:Uncharacterised protein [Vibrio cholerae]|uniref:Uncharacterized protein n=1 Tax=Vibrio cholerae TaxID=666 RepID=A0A656ATZ8_VIBCL|nr:Uncharacterised protein [Vibrio cholerae]CSB33085.1 Uncharacterised protein [Vibrio cholerae]CSB70606.1 Uncharacterised protein [Vibrio cholerae]CSB74689.1 Uncharacterised protein [Vibrio cholerae]CSB86465.1 Uncharacterised protein [Vibrio cholerae]
MQLSCRTQQHLCLWFIDPRFTATLREQFTGESGDLITISAIDLITGLYTANGARSNIFLA